MTGVQLQNQFAKTLTKLGNDLSLDYNQLLHINSVYLDKPYMFLFNEHSELSICNIDLQYDDVKQQNIQKEFTKYINQHSKQIIYYYTDDSIVKDMNNNLFYKDNRDQMILISCLTDEIRIDYDEISFNCFNFLLENNSILLDNVHRINEFYCSNNMNLSSIKIPQNVKIISRSAFEDCVNLHEITFNDSLEQIRDYAFANCVNLYDVDLSKTHINTFFKKVFYNCSNLQRIKFPKTLGFLELSFIDDCVKLNTIDLSECVPFEIQISDDLLSSLKNKSLKILVNEFDKYKWIELNEFIYAFFKVKIA